MQLNMDGRGALVTGASLGIGLAIGKRFAESGANVALMARRPEVLAEAKAAVEAVGRQGVKVITISADVTKAEDCKRAVEQAQSEFGQVDVLVNNAGSSKRGPFVEHTDEVWQTDLEIKLFGAIRLCRQVLPGMRERRWGRIINVLNTGAKAAPAEGSPTAVTRAAGMALTKAIANEYAPHNVLVNALLVGRIESDQWVRRSQASGRPLEDIYAEMGKTVPMGRVGTAEEFANMACFLASDAGSYITGTAINIDGGLSPMV